MKRIMRHGFYLLLVAFMVGCKNKENVTNTIEWINNAEKPISATIHSFNGATLENRYTLIDNKGNIYNTGCVELTLPTTIIAN